MTAHLCLRCHKCSMPDKRLVLPIKQMDGSVINEPPPNRCTELGHNYSRAIDKIEHCPQWDYLRAAAQRRK